VPIGQEIVMLEPVGPVVVTTSGVAPIGYSNIAFYITITKSSGHDGLPVRRARAVGLIAR
jgi:hypothetical protein